MTQLILTTAQWCNRRKPKADGTLKWSKVLAHSGHGILAGGFFRYGTYTPSFWPAGDLQLAIICTPEAGLIVVDVDDEGEYLTTAISRFVGREQATTVRGDHFHVWLDARDLQCELWPTMGPISRTDHVKSCGFVPAPGSVHYSSQVYELAVPGWLRVTVATREMIAALVADRMRISPGAGRMGVVITAAREAGNALLNELMADQRPSCPETDDALTWAVDRLDQAVPGHERHRMLTGGLRRFLQLGVEGHTGITAATNVLCGRWDELTAGEGREDEATAIELWAACKAATRPRSAGDPCEVLARIAGNMGWTEARQ